MYLIIEVIDGEIGVIKSRDTWEDAVEIATDIVMEQEVDSLDRTSVYKTIDENNGFDLPNWYVEICMADPT